jgi:cell wall-associated NlpC family hydrolase
MKRSVVAALAAALALAAAGGAQADTFTVVPGEVTLPSAEIPNEPGDIAFPAEISKPPAVPDRLTYAELLALWQQAGTSYGVPWELLAAINEVESNFGGNMGPSYAGAVGWMQFMPSTWDRWGVDANGDGVADPWNPTDGVFSAARYLAASGAKEDIPGAVWSYNHSEEYVQLVLGLAGEFLANPLRGRTLLADVPVVDNGAADLDAQLAKAQRRADDLWKRIGEIGGELDDSYRDLLVAEQALGDPTLGDRAFEAARRDVSDLDTHQQDLEAELTSTRDELDLVQEQIAVLEQTIVEDQSILSQSGIEGLIGDPPTAEASAVIDYALQQLGIPYHWGGNHGVGLEDMMLRDPSIPAGFDCSSLLAWSFAKGAGIYIGDFTGTQWEYGATAPGAMRGTGPARGGSAPPGGFMAGDLIFFNATQHVALYLGNDLFIHAPHTGDVVRVARLSQYPLQVWGWVRYANVSGLTFGGNPPAKAPRVFDVEQGTQDGETVVEFTRA